MLQPKPVAVRWLGGMFGIGVMACMQVWPVAQGPIASSTAPPAGEVTIAEEACSATTIGINIPVARVGAPVRAVRLAAPTWTPASATNPPYCRVDGVMDPID